MSFQLIFLPCVSLGEFLFMPSYSPSEEWWCQARWIVGSWHPFCLPSPQQWILQTHTCAQMTLPPLGFRGPESPQNLQPLGLGPSAWWLWSRGHSLTPPCWWCVVTGISVFGILKITFWEGKLFTPLSKMRKNDFLPLIWLSPRLKLPSCQIVIKKKSYDKTGGPRMKLLAYLSQNR